MTEKLTTQVENSKMLLDTLIWQCQRVKGVLTGGLNILS